MSYISFQPSDYFNTKLYTGNATTDHAQTGVGFQPDWLWIKERGGTGGHILVDAVRGVSSSSTPFIKTNSTGAEVSSNTNDFIKSLDSDGFTLGADSYFTDVNKNSSTYASWNWKANGAGSSNTDGSITSTVSANTTSGFSIVSFNGQTGTVGHGLGVKPSMIILKCRAVSNNWVIQHKGLTGGMDENALIFTTSAEISAPTAEPTTSVFTVNNQIAENNDNIAYVFAEKKGFSKFGSYTGNGNNDGSFIYLGFRPAWVMIKRTNTAEGWYIIDSKRTGFNEANYALIAQGSSAEETGTNRINLLSNGFKATTSNTAVNGSSDNYIYMAFAEAPLVSSNGVPAVAR